MDLTLLHELFMNYSCNSDTRRNSQIGWKQINIYSCGFVVVCELDSIILVISLFQAVLWRYKFSQLKGSSDDGKSKIKFLFQNQDSKSIEAKVID